MPAFYVILLTVLAFFINISMKIYCPFNPNSHKDFFVSRLLGKGGVQKMGVSPGYEPGVSCTTMRCPPLAHHSGVADRAAISCLYDTSFYDVIGLKAFSSDFPLLDFVGLRRVRVRE